MPKPQRKPKSIYQSSREVNIKYEKYIEKQVEEMIEEINEQEYLTIAEFAKRVNVSKQAIYQQLDKKLKPYLIVIDGKKKLNIKAMSEVYDKQREEIDKEVVQEENNKLIEVLTQQLMEKDKQLTEKDNQINGLIKSLSVAQMQFTEVSHRLQELTDKSHEEPDHEEPETQQSVSEEETQQDVAEDSKDQRIQELEAEIERLEAERKLPWWKKIFKSVE